MGERGKSQRVGQLLPSRGPEWMGIRHHEQETGPPSKSGFFIFFARGLINSCLYIVWISVICTLFKYKCDYGVVKINHAWSAPSSYIWFLGTILVVAKQYLSNGLSNPFQLAQAEVDLDHNSMYLASCSVTMKQGIWCSQPAGLHKAYRWLELVSLAS